MAIKRSFLDKDTSYEMKCSCSNRNADFPSFLEISMPLNCDALQVQDGCFLHYSEDAETLVLMPLKSDAPENRDGAHSHFHVDAPKTIWEDNGHIIVCAITSINTLSFPQPCRENRMDLHSTLLCGDVQENPGPLALHPSRLVNYTPYDITLINPEWFVPSDFNTVIFSKLYYIWHSPEFDENHGDPLQVYESPYDFRNGWGEDQFQCSNFHFPQFMTPTKSILEVRLSLHQVFLPEIVGIVSGFIGNTLLTDHCDCIRVVRKRGATQFSNFVDRGRPIPRGRYQRYCYPMALVTSKPYYERSWMGDVDGWEGTILSSLDKCIYMHCVKKMEGLLSAYSNFISSVTVKLHAYADFYAQEIFPLQFPTTIVNLFPSMHIPILSKISDFIGTVDTEGIPLWLWPVHSLNRSHEIIHKKVNFKCEGRKSKSAKMVNQNLPTHYSTSHKARAGNKDSGSKRVSFADPPEERVPKWVKKEESDRTSRSSGNVNVPCEEPVMSGFITNEKTGYFEATCLNTESNHCTKLTVKYVDGHDPTLCCLLSALRHSEVVPVKVFDNSLDFFFKEDLRRANALCLSDLDVLADLFRMRLKFHVIVYDHFTMALEYHQVVLGNTNEPIVDARVMLVPAGFTSHSRVKFKRKSMVSDFTGDDPDSGHAFLIRSLTMRLHDCDNTCPNIRPYDFLDNPADYARLNITEVDDNGVMNTNEPDVIAPSMTSLDDIDGDVESPFQSCVNVQTLVVDSPVLPSVSSEIISASQTCEIGVNSSSDFSGDLPSQAVQSSVPGVSSTHTQRADIKPDGVNCSILRSGYVKSSSLVFMSSSTFLRHIPTPSVRYIPFVVDRIGEYQNPGEIPLIPEHIEPQLLLDFAESLCHEDVLDDEIIHIKITDFIKKNLKDSVSLLGPTAREELAFKLLSSACDEMQYTDVRAEIFDAVESYVRTYIREFIEVPTVFSTPIISCPSWEGFSSSCFISHRSFSSMNFVYKNELTFSTITVTPGRMSRYCKEELDMEDPYLSKISSMREAVGWKSLDLKNCPPRIRSVRYRTIARSFPIEVVKLSLFGVYRVSKSLASIVVQNKSKYRDIELCLPSANILAAHVCQFIELPSSKVSYIGDIDEARVPSQEVWGDFNVDLWGVNINIQMDTPWFNIGVGERAWWHKSPSITEQISVMANERSRRKRLSFLNCGPTRPDTLYKIPHRYWGSTLDDSPDYSIFVHDHGREFTVNDDFMEEVTDNSSINPGLGCDHDASITKSPVIEGDHAFVFQRTGIKINFEGKMYEELIAIKIFASAVKKVRKVSMLRDRTCPEIEKYKDGSLDLVRFRGRWDMPCIPLRMHQACMRLVVGTGLSEGLKHMLATILVTPTASMPDFSLTPIGIVVWTDYYMMMHNRFHAALSMRVEAGKRSKGIAVQHNPRDDEGRKCNNCRLFAPRKFSWRKGLCENCFFLERFGYKFHPISINYSNPDMPQCLPIGVTALPGPTSITPMIANAKVKPLREGGSYGRISNSSRFKKLGYTKPNRVKTMTNSGAFLFGVGFGTRSGTFSKGVENEDIALRYRLFSAPDNPPEPGIFDSALTFIVQQRWFTGPSYPISRMGFCSDHDMDVALLTPKDQEVIKRNMQVLDLTISGQGESSWISTFPPSRRKAYYDIMKEDCTDLRNFPVIFDFFLKVELSCCPARWMQLEPSPSNPRMICSPSLHTHILMGTYMRPLTEALHSEWGLDAVITYAGGLTPLQLNQWLASVSSPDCMRFLRPGTVAVENDYAKFDCTYSESALNFVKSVYCIMGLDIEKLGLGKVWEGWAKPTGFMRSGRKVVGPIMNASGRDDTALMNAFINGTVQYLSYYYVLVGTDAWLDNNIEHIKWFEENFRVIVLGDDSLTLVPEKTMRNEAWTLQQVVAQVDRYGFEARDVKLRHCPCECVFLGNRPYPALTEIDGYTTTRPVWGPTIGRRIVRLSYMLNYERAKDGYAWLRGICTAAKRSYSHVPILNDLVEMMLRVNLTKQSTPKLVDPNKLDMCLENCRESPLCAEVLMHVYGISKMDRDSIRRDFDNVIKLPSVVINSKLEEVILMDI